MASKCSIKGLLEPPSPAQLKTILATINEESEEKLLHNERLLDEWIKCQNHFPKDIDKGTIRGTLRGCKHILEKSKLKLESYLAARHLHPEFYVNRSPFSKDVLQAMDVVNIATLPKLSPDGYTIGILVLHQVELSNFNMQCITKLVIMIVDILISSNNMFAGSIIILDGAQMTTGHYATFFGPIFKKIMSLVTEIYPLRIKALHAINTPNFAKKMFLAVKPLLTEKIKNRIHFHDKLENLVDEFGPDLMPSDYGGNLKSVREIATDWYDILKANADWFHSQENVKITKIPKEIKSSFHLDQLGVDGSFRKLVID